MDMSDYLERSAYTIGGSQGYAGHSTAPCQSCGGGCYGCKGSKISVGAELSLSERGSEETSTLIREILLE